MDWLARIDPLDIAISNSILCGMQVSVSDAKNKLPELINGRRKRRTGDHMPPGACRGGNRAHEKARLEKSAF